jgi:hypothetical protein
MPPVVTAAENAHSLAAVGVRLRDGAVDVPVLDPCTSTAAMAAAVDAFRRGMAHPPQERLADVTVIVPEVPAPPVPI